MRSPLSLLAVVLLGLVTSVGTPRLSSAALLQPPAVVYVAPDGDDDGSCDSPVSRCRTLGRALAAVAPGGTVLLAGGTYTENAVVSQDVIVSGGHGLPEFRQEGAPTTLTGGGNGTTLRIAGPASIVLSDLTITGGVGARATGGQDWVRGQGGGIAAVDADLILQRVSVTGNVAAIGGSGEGGGLHIRGGSLAMLASKVEGNTALMLPDPGQSGGGGGATPVPEQPNRWPLEGRGGGLFVARAHLMIRGSMIAGNYAVAGAAEQGKPLVADGGGLFATQSELDIEDSELASNAALTSSVGWAPSEELAAVRGGGAALVHVGASLRDVAIDGNRAGRGGGLEVRGGGRLVVERSTFSGNEATDQGRQGAGIMLRPLGVAPGALTLTNVLMAGQRGAALTLAPEDTAAVEVRHATLVGNTVGLQVSMGGTIDVSNSTIVGSVVAARGDGGTVALQYSNRFGNAVDAEGQVLVGPRGGLAVDPGFVPGDRHYRLARGSALVDEGTQISGVVEDFEGDPRPLDGRVGGRPQPDIGWDELAVSFPAFGQSPAPVARPGEALALPLTLVNEAGLRDSFSLRISGPEGWQASVTPTAVTLGSRERATLTIALVVPPDVPWNSQAVFTVRAEGQYGQAETQIAVLVEEL